MRRRFPGRGPHHRRGFALLTVLWFVALLALIASVVLSSGLASRRSSHVAFERAEADALAEAGINDAILSLLAPQPGNQRRVDGVPYVLTFAGAEIAVSIQDEHGKIDLNHADGALLARLFTSVGIAPDEAAALSDRIQDWREAGAGRRVNGAIAEDYRAAGYDYGPRNRPFQSVDELKLVMGMSQELFRKVAPALTVYSHRGSVNRQTAPRAVLLALDVADGAGADQFIADRAAAGTAGSGISGGTLAPSIALTDWAFAIHAELTMPSGGVFGREAVVRFTNDPRRPYWIHAWRSVSAE